LHKTSKFADYFKKIKISIDKLRRFEYTVCINRVEARYARVFRTIFPEKTEERANRRGSQNAGVLRRRDVGEYPPYCHRNVESYRIFGYAIFPQLSLRVLF